MSLTSVRLREAWNWRGLTANSLAVGGRQEVLADLAGRANQLGLAVVHEAGSPASGSSARPGGRVRRCGHLTRRPLSLRQRYQ
jgi:hypothetical protein